jgi:hypothetical protein
LAFGECSALDTICIPAGVEALEREWFLSSHFYGGFVFDTVRFERGESLVKMMRDGCADWSGDFDIVVGNWKEKTVIPGDRVVAVVSNDLVLLRKSLNSVLSKH